jgi:hypothetical protein
VAIGAEIAPAHPTPIGTIWVGAEMRGGVHLAAAPSCGHDAGWRGAGGLWTEVAGMRTGVAMRLGGAAHKGCGLPLALGPWGWRLWCRRARGGGVAGPRPLEHKAQPHQGDQHQLIEKEIRDHGQPPSYKCRNEGILPDFQTAGISRRLQGHNQVSESTTNCGRLRPGGSSQSTTQTQTRRETCPGGSQTWTPSGRRWASTMAHAGCAGDG